MLNKVKGGNVIKSPILEWDWVDSEIDTFNLVIKIFANINAPLGIFLKGIARCCAAAKIQGGLNL
jgi:hypothetical protein